MTLPPPGSDDPRGPDDSRRNGANGDWSGPPRFGAGALRWLGSRPDLLMAAAGVLIVGMAVFMPQSPPPPPPGSGAIERAAPAPVAGALPGVLPTGTLADEAALLATASEAAGLATGPAAPLPPPPPSAVLAPEGDAVFAAAEPARPEPEPSAPARRKSGAVLIFDAGAGDAGADATPAPEVSIAPTARRTPAAAAASGRSAPSRGTLTQGTAIPAVLESAIDSTRPGSVRALVSTDVRSADGRRVLVPRSSRLVGQYRGDPGTARAFVVWTRIERPDGSRVPLASAGQGARFKESYAASPLVSQVGGADAAGSVRVRPGEPIRVVASRSVDLQESRR